MNRRWKLGALVAACLILAGAAQAVLVSEESRRRVSVVSMKLHGGLDDLSWGELVRLLGSGNGAQLKKLAEIGNPYGAIRNPFPNEGAAGRALFQSHCASCHGAGGEGGAGPDLTVGRFLHGVSDWAIYRTITRGIPGTSMSGVALPERQAWQIVAYVQSVAAPASEAAVPEAQTAISPVTDERLRTAAERPGEWLTYSGTFDSIRYSRLTDIDQASVNSLRLKWVYQFAAGNQPVESTPLVIDDVMYVTEPPSSVLALDAATGKLRWQYRRTMPQRLRTCCYPTNRGVAAFDRHVYLGTLDGHLVALDRATGRVEWDVEVGSATDGYSITGAPLAFDGKILIGVAGGEFSIRGYVDAYDAQSGARLWRFYTVPGPGEP